MNSSAAALINSGTAAEILGYGVRHARRLLEWNNVPKVFMGRKLKFRRADVIALKEQLAKEKPHD